MDKRFSLKGSLLQYILLSCIGTFFSILLLRWISVPEYGFTRHMLIALASAAVFTLIGLLISGSSRHIREDASFWNFRRIAATVMIATHFITLPISNIWLLLPVRIVLAAALYYATMRMLHVVILQECLQFVFKKKRQ